MTEALDFQTIFMTLQKFWADQGCLIWQPYYTQVGAGTMNPATVLRVLGPEPWNVAYVEPSIRPDDGRYGENPNRFQQHYQFQVILKPDPGNPQEIYLKSLEALGINPHQHDIRFVEDNWESPALGAWGLGWEVWLDGQEITQFTYFQQAGGMLTDPVSVEITYGLDRIAMALQGVRHFRQLHWNDKILYGDINYQGEFEHSRYYFEVADVERLRQMYALFEAEAESALKQGLVLPAHDYILKLSHTFNVLDTRGAVGVTERQAMFARMRDLSRRVAEIYLEQRKALEYPWLKAEDRRLEVGAGPSGAEKRATAMVAAPAVSLSPLESPQAFLLEIGTEELPAADLDSALAQLTDRVPAWLAELRLACGEIQVLGTPRRLVVFVKEVAPLQQERESVIKGPPAERAFDSQGNPTRAGEGFARSKGLTPADLQVHELDGGKYVVAVIHEAGRLADEVLAEALPGLVAGIKFEKSMRWNASNVAFSRPIRWLLALFGERLVPFEYAGLCSANRTRGLRFHDPEELEVHDPQAYFNFLTRLGILLDPAERRTVIAGQVKALLTEVGATERLDDGLLDEVTNLVEAPTALRGRFDDSHLHLPPEVLVSVMKKHQRYFPAYLANGKLLPFFIAVRNGDGKYINIVTDGNEQVIRARFADALFFINEDLKHKLQDLLPRLGTLMFQTKLGSMLDKSQRIEKLVEKLSPVLRLNDGESRTALRAAKLCKADLVSHMVVEMTSVQGIMGRYYALHSGEAEDVAQAIFEHYLPRSADDDLPLTKPGIAVGVADRLDSLAGLFAAGLAPSGTRDPFALRRAALGLVQLFSRLNLDFDLKQGLAMAAEGLPISSAPDSQAACLDFIVGRLRSYLMELPDGYRYDVVEAVLAVQQRNPAGVVRAVRQLSGWVARPDWSTILPAYARCVRITREFSEHFKVDPSLFSLPAERDLYAALRDVQDKTLRIGSVDSFLSAFLPLIPPINKFFVDVLVMVDDPAVRQNRLGLLQRIAFLADGVADLSKLEGF
jgi:glycyl-tRNA synthetase